MKNAFTLLELVVTMGILAVISAMSIFGLVRFRAVIELNNGYTDIVSLLKTTQNAARNVTSSGGQSGVSVPALYTIRFSDNTYTQSNCTSTSNRYICIDLTTQKTVAPSVSFSPDPNCAYIGFAPLTGEIISLNLSGIATTVQQCSIRIAHSISGDVKTLNVDLLSNTIQNI